MCTFLLRKTCTMCTMFPLHGQILGTERKDELMNKEQKKVYSQYLRSAGPGAGSLKTAFLRGQAGTRNVYFKTSLAWAAWKAGRDSSQGQPE